MSDTIIRYLNHWPPLPDEVADAFATLEAEGLSVTLLRFRPGDLHDELEGYTDDGSLWGAAFAPPPDDAPPQHFTVVGTALDAILCVEIRGPGARP